ERNSRAGQVEGILLPACRSRHTRHSNEYEEQEAPHVGLIHRHDHARQSIEVVPNAVSLSGSWERSADAADPRHAVLMAGRLPLLPWSVLANKALA
ncbi:MAG TPA: hypothetical protein VF637_16885, partial [Sphingomicrobium sp.]